MRILFGIFVFTLVFGSFTNTAKAESSVLEIPMAAKYDFAKDPLLLIWNTVTEKNKPKVTNTGELSADEKKLARWKEKQAHLWAKLETGKRFTINASAYTAAADECGKSDGITASGIKVFEGRTLACPPEFPFGAMIAIEGVGVLRCEDRGGAIKGNKFDIYMETKSDAFAFGRRNLTAEIVQ